MQKQLGASWEDIIGDMSETFKIQANVKTSQASLKDNMIRPKIHLSRRVANKLRWAIFTFHLQEVEEEDEALVVDSCIHKDYNVYFVEKTKVIHHVMPHHDIKTKRTCNHSTN